jgi:hypothetical protein
MLADSPSVSARRRPRYTCRSDRTCVQRLPGSLRRCAAQRQMLTRARALTRAQDKSQQQLRTHQKRIDELTAQREALQAQVAQLQQQARDKEREAARLPAPSAGEHHRTHTADSHGVTSPAAGALPPPPPPPPPPPVSRGPPARRADATVTRALAGRRRSCSSARTLRRCTPCLRCRHRGTWRTERGGAAREKCTFIQASRFHK